MTGVPSHGQPLVDDAGRLTRPWMAWVQAVTRAAGASDAASIAAIARALGSPDGTIEHIPPPADNDALIVGLAGIMTEGRLSAGRVTVSLLELEDSGEGAALVKITRDAYGRVEGMQAATTTDLAEGGNLYFTTARADARVSAGVAAHVALPDPHGQYVLDAEKGAASGVATLGPDSKLDPGQLPALAITETFVVASQAAMLALTAQQGDVAVRTDLNKSLILTADPASTLGNWQELLTPTGAVSSFNGRTGAIVPASGDYTAAQVGAEAAFGAGTTAQYLRGDKGWRDFATDVRAAILTGLSTATSTAVAATDSVLTAIGKLQAQISAKVGASRTINTTAPLTGGGDLSADRTLGISAATTSAAGSMSAADKAKLDGIAPGATANSTDATLLNRANHTGTQLAATVSDFADAVRATFSGALASRSTNQSVPDSTDTAISFDTEVYDTAGFWASGAASRFTIAATGYYEVATSHRWAASGTGLRMTSLKKNGSEVPGGFTQQDAAAAGVQTSYAVSSGAIFCTAGDYIEIIVFQSSGGALNLIAGSRSGIWASIRRVG